MRRAAYLYITAEGIPPTVFDSQVLEPLLDLARAGLRFDLLAFAGWRGDPAEIQAERTRLAEVSRLLAPARVRLRPLPYRASRPGMWLAALLAAAWLAPAAVRGRPCVVHCRGHLAAFIGARLRRLVPRCRIVFDMRGDILAEEPAWAGAPPLEPEEARAVASACRILCVSEAFRRHLMSRYPAVAERIVVIPCAADERLFRYDPNVRARVRDELGLSGRRVLAYCGGLGLRWQLAEEMIAAFARYREADPDARLLLVTPDVAAARRLAAEAGLNDVDVMALAVPHAQVPRFLMAGDVGLLLRRRDAVNLVASPTKLAEYLMTGLPVVICEGVGDSDRLVRDGGFGAVVADVADEAALQAALAEAFAMPSDDEQRRRRAEEAAGLLSASAQLGKRIEVYEACAQE